MDKLAKIAGETEKFLRFLSSDIGARSTIGEWISKNFYNSSVGFTVELANPVDDVVLSKFNSSVDFFVSFREGRSTINGSYSPRTIKQFVALGKSLDADELMRIGLYKSADAEDAEWRDLSRRPALDIERYIETPLIYHGSIQGRLATWYKEANYFDLKESLFGRTVKCQYDDSKYKEIHSLYGDKNTVVHVVGIVEAERIDGTPKSIQVEHLKYYDSLTDKEFQKLFGIAPDLTGDESTESFIDRMRSDDSA